MDIPKLSPKAEEIVLHATRLLALGGYNSFSYADIAEVVGISKPSIHHHFPSKVELVRVAVARYRALSRQGLQALTERMEDPQARLQAYCAYWAQCIEASSPPICIFPLLASELPSIPQEVADEVRGHFEELAAWLQAAIESGMAAGEIRTVKTAEFQARSFMASVHGAMLAARALGDPMMFRGIVSAALDGLQVEREDEDPARKSARRAVVAK
ncbi:MAG TPA: TetR/AcrR family transcriptional regulator [Stenotrophomonas sp.]|nr:TetR/AcrR family transcriptional regulator [Stenotrophomonas sp.]